MELTKFPPKAIKALRKLGLDHKEIEDQLNGVTDDPEFTMRRFAAGSTIDPRGLKVEGNSFAVQAIADEDGQQRSSFLVNFADHDWLVPM